jgi:hypothetical protein
MSHDQPIRDFVGPEEWNDHFILFESCLDFKVISAVLFVLQVPAEAEGSIDDSIGSQPMTLVNQLMNRDSTEGDRTIFGKRQRPIDLRAMCRVRHPGLVLLFAPEVHTLHDEIVDALKMTAPDLFFNQALCFGLEADRHRHNLPGPSGPSSP